MKRTSTTVTQCPQPDRRRRRTSPRARPPRDRRVRTGSDCCPALSPFTTRHLHSAPLPAASFPAITPSSPQRDDRVGRRRRRACRADAARFPRSNQRDGVASDSWLSRARNGAVTAVAEYCDHSSQNEPLTLMAQRMSFPYTEVRMVLKQRPSRRPPRTSDRASAHGSPAHAVPSPGAPACTHHWVIEQPGPEPTSTGLCRGCGAERQFPTRLSWIPRREFMQQPRVTPDLGRPSSRTSFGAERVLSDDVGSGQ